MYIVSSGEGYFVEFDNGSPLMDTDIMRASRVSGDRAVEIIEQLDSMGFVGDLVEVRWGRMPAMSPWGRRKKSWWERLMNY